MSRPSSRPQSWHQSAQLSNLHQLQNMQLRDPAQIASHGIGVGCIDPRLLKYKVQGEWWDTLAELGITLLVTREYEHLVMAIGADRRVSYFPLPHPSGLVVDRRRSIVHVASTRNPNQVFDLAPVIGLRKRFDVAAIGSEAELIPVRSRFYPGCLYIHDLAIISNKLYANSVGENAVLVLSDNGQTKRVWWPKCIEVDNEPIFMRNHIQLNSIAAGKSLTDSYFSASSAEVTHLRPGHLRFPVDKRGVIFSGATREPFARGLTRPHSARVYRGTVWVDNSGYGELGYADEGWFHPVVQLPGWTRGLCFHGNTAFVGTSRVIPRFRCYAPGLDVESSVCAVYAVDVRTAKIMGSLSWEWGNQIFAIDWLPREVTGGFPWVVGQKRPARIKKLFYAFTTEVNR
jgi:uncharacterized protein (TIGR03032 family)